MHRRLEVAGVRRVDAHPVAVVAVARVRLVVGSVLPQLLGVEVADVALHLSLIEERLPRVCLEVVRPVRTSPLEAHVRLRIVQIRLRRHNHVARRNYFWLKGG